MENISPYDFQGCLLHVNIAGYFLESARSQRVHKTGASDAIWTGARHALGSDSYSTRKQLHVSVISVPNRIAKEIAA
jgi:hypothetical protein